MVLETSTDQHHLTPETALQTTAVAARVSKGVEAKKKLNLTRGKRTAGQKTKAQDGKKRSSDRTSCLDFKPSMGM